jgi:hypothetical protein
MTKIMRNTAQAFNMEGFSPIYIQGPPVLVFYVPDNVRRKKKPVK